MQKSAKYPLLNFKQIRHEYGYCNRRQLRLLQFCCNTQRQCPSVCVIPPCYNYRGFLRMEVYCHCYHHLCGKEDIHLPHQHLSGNAFTEDDQCACNKRGVFLVAEKSGKILQIRILCNLLHEFTVSILKLCLDDQSP